MDRRSDLQEIEHELLVGFREHRKQGKYYYDPELKKKISEAYSLNISPKRIAELCGVSLSSAQNWLYIHREQTSNLSQPSESNFREVKISSSEQEQTISQSCSHEQENSASIQEQGINFIKIKFPNGIEIECKTTEVNKFIHDLYFIKN